MNKTRINCYTPSNSPDQNERIKHDLEQLGLHSIIPCFTKLAEENIINGRTPKDYIEELLEIQRHSEEDKRIQTRIRQAKFKRIYRLKDYNFKEQPSVDPRLIHDLATGGFISENKNIVFWGNSGVGKTHLAVGIGMEIIISPGYEVRFIELGTLIEEILFKHKDVDSRHTFFMSLIRPKLLILDEVKFYETSSLVKDFLYRLLHQRLDYGNPIILISNSKDLSEWEGLLGDNAEAIIDRVLQEDRRILIKIDGPSHRVPNGQPF